MVELPGIATELPPDKASDEARERGARELSDEEIVQILEGYRTEAEYARLAGPNSRDMTWLQNLDLYWNRYDFSKKAPWQAREVMPELPMYVDRFAAAMRTALVSSERFFTVQVTGDEERDMADVIRKFMVVQLRRIGRSPSNHPVDFLAVFEEIMKFGALMMNCAIVLQKPDPLTGGSYTALEPVDPYNVWLDATGRNLYRIRRIEMDLHELRALAKQTDKKGIPLYKQDEINSLADSVIALMRAEREKRGGTGQWQTSTRRPVVLHEYLATLVDDEGNVQGENVLCVVANNHYLIRGPEKNPFWHGRDWLISSPIITVPLSPYGRGYVENFAPLAKTFNELTNLILDGVFTSAMKAFAVVPSMLEDSSQIDEGVYPNVAFRLNEGADPKDFIKEVNLGQFSPEVLNIWSALKKEMQEGAAFNDITLGNLAPKGRTSATEVGSVEQNATSYIKSMASNIETLFLEPVLDIIWKTSIQHLSPKDKELEQALGPEWFQAFLKRKKEFAKHKIDFVCRGISSIIVKSQKLQGLLQLLQIVQGNQLLLQKFVQEVDIGKLLDFLFDLFDIEKERLVPTAREKMIMQLQQLTEMLNQLQAGGGAPAPQGAVPTPGVSVAPRQAPANQGMAGVAPGKMAPHPAGNPATGMGGEANGP